MTSDVRQFETAGDEMHALISRLFPICRSITGDGVRETLAILQEQISLDVHEVPSGTPVFDWQVPQEWKIRDAYIKDARGTRLVDFAESNLHVVGGSVGLSASMRWSELKQHVHTLPEYPSWIPYRTSFHKESWGFCMTHELYQWFEAQAEADDDSSEYEVCIDAELFDGSLTYGELFVPGETDEEVLITAHVCHPSLANDNLSGIAVATMLAKELAARERRYGYRFVFAPATIGAITWLSQNRRRLDNIKHGLILSLLGDAADSTYKKTRHGDAEIDAAVAHVFKHYDADYRLVDFEPFGYDERQYASPGIYLSIGCLMRSRNEEYAEYHTSADNLGLVRSEYLDDSLEKLLAIVNVLEGNQRYVNQKPMCEPRLGPYGLYHGYGCEEEQAWLQKAVQWVLNLSDGQHSLLEIAERAGYDFALIRDASDALLEAGLLKVATDTMADDVSGPVATAPAAAALLHQDESSSLPTAQDNSPFATEV